MPTTSQPVPPSPASPADVGPWNRCAFQAVRVVLWLLAKALTLDGLYRLGQGFGLLEWCINYKRRRAFGRRLRQVFGAEFPPAVRRRVTRAHFQTTRCDKIFYLALDLLPREQVLKRFHIDNHELMDEGLARGHGVYVALSHHGAHHVAGLCLALLGYRVAGVRDRKEGAIRRFIQQKYDRKYPELHKLHIIFSDAYPREIYRCFENNYTLGSALDVHRPREPHQKAAPITIFGEQRLFLTGTLQIALRCRATVLQGFILSEPGFHYRFQLLGPLVEPDRSGDTPQLLADVLQTYAENIALYARRYPSHITRV
ncbi:MAG: hypothetical protein V2A79_15415 [Planctomycetota bacterium]